MAGMAAGAAIGAAVSGPGAPLGAAIGAAAGAMAGGLAGKSVAERIDPTVEDEYWREHHCDGPYAGPTYTYDRDYRPAYLYGASSRKKYSDRAFIDAESELARGWDAVKGKSRLSWDQARIATRAAWRRLEHAQPANTDHNGR